MGLLGPLGFRALEGRALGLLGFRVEGFSVSSVQGLGAILEASFPSRMFAPTLFGDVGVRKWRPYPPQTAAAGSGEVQVSVYAISLLRD